ncbi:hypothetical protein GCM10010331_04910 [Streptomyces xanthochromogenes]|nr:hypothetical protein GCM10010331_04910 [Streptomyces xanthochromogenes]
MLGLGAAGAASALCASRLTEASAAVVTPRAGTAGRVLVRGLRCEGKADTSFRSVPDGGVPRLAAAR